MIIIYGTIYRGLWSGQEKRMKMKLLLIGIIGIVSLSARGQGVGWDDVYPKPFLRCDFGDHTDFAHDTKFAPKPISEGQWQIDYTYYYTNSYSVRVVALEDFSGILDVRFRDAQGKFVSSARVQGRESNLHGPLYVKTNLMAEPNYYSAECWFYRK
jgi:hypothetical protein